MVNEHQCVLCGAAENPGYPGVYDCDCCLTAEWQSRQGPAAENAEARLAFLKASLNASVPARYRGYLRTPVAAQFRRDNPEVGRLASYTLTPGSVLYLHGLSGTGKTHAALRAVVRLVTEEKLTAAFVGEADYFKSLTDSFGGHGAAFDATTPQVLVYDDLGRRRPTPVVLDELYRILEHRWSNELTTIITSNFSPLQAVLKLTDDADLGGGIMSRLACGDIYEVKGAQDYRIGTARSA